MFINNNKKKPSACMTCGERVQSGSVSKRREEGRPLNKKSAYDTINKRDEMTLKVSIRSIGI